MKILHVIPSVSPKRGGPSFAVRAMAEIAVHQGFQVDIVTTDDDGSGHLDVALGKPLIENGVCYRYFRRQTDFYTASWPLTKWLAKNVSNYDLVHIHALFSYSMLPAAYFARRANVPYIIRPLGTLNRWGIANRRAFLKQISLLLIEKPLLFRAARLHFTSMQERIEAAEAGLDLPFKILPLGINLQIFSDLPEPHTFYAQYPQLHGKKILLFLSRIDLKKGLELLLAATALITQTRNDFVLFIAGDGEEDYKAQLKQRSFELKIDDNIIWGGFLSGIPKLAAMAAADIFVLPSYSENFGIAVVEAMAAGLPVIISDQVGIHNEIDTAKAGIVTKCDSDILSSSIQQLLNNNQLCQEMGQNGQRLAQEQFSLEAMSDGLIQLYRQVISDSTKAGDSNPISIQKPVASKK